MAFNGVTFRDGTLVLIQENEITKSGYDAARKYCLLAFWSTTFLNDGSLLIRRNNLSAIVHFDDAYGIEIASSVFHEWKVIQLEENEVHISTNKGGAKSIYIGAVNITNVEEVRIERCHVVTRDLKDLQKGYPSAIMVHLPLARHIRIFSISWNYVESHSVVFRKGCYGILLSGSDMSWVRQMLFVGNFVTSTTSPGHGVHPLLLSHDTFTNFEELTLENNTIRASGACCVYGLQLWGSLFENITSLTLRSNDVNIWGGNSVFSTSLGHSTLRNISSLLYFNNSLEASTPAWPCSGVDLPKTKFYSVNWYFFNNYIVTVALKHKHWIRTYSNVFGNVTLFRRVGCGEYDQPMSYQYPRPPTKIVPCTECKLKADCSPWALAVNGTAPWNCNCQCKDPKQQSSARCELWPLAPIISVSNTRSISMNSSLSMSHSTKLTSSLSPSETLKKTRTQTNNALLDEGSATTTFVEPDEITATLIKAVASLTIRMSPAVSQISSLVVRSNATQEPNATPESTQGAQNITVTQTDVIQSVMENVVPKEAAVSVVASASATNAAAAIMNPTQPSQAIRVLAVMKLARCSAFQGDEDSWELHPSRFEFPIQIAIGETKFRFWMGAILVNLCLVVVPFVLSLLLQKMIASERRERSVNQQMQLTQALATDESEEEMSESPQQQIRKKSKEPQERSASEKFVRYILSPMCALTFGYCIPSILGASFSVLFEKGADGIAALVAVVAIISSISCLAWTAYVVISNSVFQENVKINTEEAKEGEKVEPFGPVSTSSTSHAFVAVYRLYIDPARNLSDWRFRALFFEDVLLSSLVGFLTAINPPTRAGCTAIGVAVLLPGCLHIVYLLYFRPYAKKLEQVFACLNGVLMLGMASCAFGTIYQREDWLKPLAIVLLCAEVFFLVQTLTLCGWAIVVRQRRAYHKKTVSETEGQPKKSGEMRQEVEQSYNPLGHQEGSVLQVPLLPEPEGA